MGSFVIGLSSAIGLVLSVRATRPTELDADTSMLQMAKLGKLAHGDVADWSEGADWESEGKEWLPETTECPDVAPSKWQQCKKTDGCVYMAASIAKTLKDLPDIAKYAGKCTLLKSIEAASQGKLTSDNPDGKSVCVTSSKGKHCLPVAQMCTVANTWKDDACAEMCNPDSSWKGCLKLPGCMYVYANSKVSSDYKILKDSFKQCVAVNGLLGSSPEGSTIAAAGGKGLGVKVKLMDGGKAVQKYLSFPTLPSTPAPGTGDASVDVSCTAGEAKLGHRPKSKWPESASSTSHILKACECWYWRKVDGLGEVSQVVTDYAFANNNPEEFMLAEYGCWRDVLSKELRMPVQFEYIASADSGNKQRLDKFLIDTTPGLEEWQPPRWAASDKYGLPFNVGHLVMANHFDGVAELIEATNMMTNVVPQLGVMNRYGWLVTEYLTECSRKGDNAENVFIIGGCVWNSTANSIPGFEKMGDYKILIPDACWKIISAPQKGHVAFWIPNSEEAKITTSGALVNGVQRGIEAISEFVVSVKELEEKLSSRKTAQTFEMSDEKKNQKPTGQQIQENGWTLKCSKM